jgi:hypothetical protein
MQDQYNLLQRMQEMVRFADQGVAASVESAR